MSGLRLAAIGRVGRADRAYLVPLAIAGAILVLAPLPPLRQLLRVGIPVGVDPVDVLVALALCVALVRARSFPFRWESRLLLFGVVNLELLAIAWYRAYGGHPSANTVGTLAHSAVLFVAGAAAVMCVGREEATQLVALATAGSLALVSVSVLAELAGLYHPPVQQVAGPLAVKLEGGIMLQANEAGALLGTFGVPTLILLRHEGYRLLAYGLLAVEVPALLVTRSREGIAAFVIGLLALAALEGRRRLVLGSVGAIVAGLILAAVAMPTRASHAIHNPNAYLKGRPTLWREAVDFVRAGNVWLNGGGLNRFETYIHGVLGYSVTTHMEYFRLLVDGGLLMVAAWIVLLAVMWLAARDAGGAEGRALQVAVVCTAAIGLARDNGPFTRGSAWLWALAALVALRQARRAGSAEAPERP